MTKLEELIQELCPDGVQFLRIPELFTTRNGYTPSKANSEFWENGTIPWFRMEDIRTNGRILTEATQCVSKKRLKGEYSLKTLLSLQLRQQSVSTHS